ncbi:MAG: cysteine desulfurase [Erysipelotrichaceae bacterium]|nr:cysteine desulfurase [Erysipelotrichaceae bacterium]
MSLYLDYNASAPISKAALDSMIDVYQNTIGNSDSRTHTYGDQARQVVETARRQVANLIGVKPGEVVFTSGATESNNMALLGLQEYANSTGRKHIITSQIEHKSILEAAHYLTEHGFDVDFVAPDSNGVIHTADILALLRPDTLIVSLMHVNNETGAIQPVKELGETLSKTDTLFHIDATQSLGKLIQEVKDLKYDMLSVSAHKIEGPQGIGALILRKKRYKFPPIKPILFGGQQEKGIRPGTVPVALTAGFGAACQEINEKSYQNRAQTTALRQILFDELKDSGLNFEINGDVETSIPSTINLYFPNVNSEALMLAGKAVCSVSNGSACNSNSYKPSYVLSAMGFSEDRIQCSVRISWGSDTNKKEFKEAIGQLFRIAKELQ